MPPRDAASPWTSKTAGKYWLRPRVYVIPAYVLNIRGEEQMMLSRYGDEYREYRRRVGAFVPRLGRA